MGPLLILFLIREFSKIFFLSLSAFLSTLVICRLEEIASFATLGGGLKMTALFLLYQFPYLLPVALPLSLLLASYLLFQRLSETSSLTQLRASSLSLFTIMMPCWIFALFISLFSFFATSELTTRSHLATRKIFYELSTKNPLLLLSNVKTSFLKDAYFHASFPKKGEGRDLLIAWQEKDKELLNLLLTKKIEMKEEKMLGKKLSFISSSQQKDYLLIENQEEVEMNAADFALLFKKQGWKMANDHLSLALLKIRYKKLQEELLASQGNSSHLVKVIAKCKSEFFRRFSLAIAPLSFTLLGTLCGIQIGRNMSRRIFLLIGCASLAFLSFFIAKELDHKPLIAFSFYFLPHVAIIWLTLYLLRRLNLGKSL